MLQLLVLFSIAILGLIIIYYIFKGKINFGGTIVFFTMLTLLPIIFLVVMPIWVISCLIMFLVILYHNGQYVGAVPVFFIALEILLLAVYGIVRMNLFPGKITLDKENSKNKAQALENGKRLLVYSIYGSLVYLVPVIILGTYFFVKYNGIIGQVILHIGKTCIILIEAVLLMAFMPLFAIPLYIISILGFIIFMSISILFFIMFVTSMNGTIRILYASEKIREKSFKYIILMFFPIINVIAMFCLYNLAKKELQSKSDYIK